MKINFTLWTTSIYGGVTAIFEIANGLSKRGHKTMITSIGGDHSWFPLKAEVNYVNIPNSLKVINPIMKLGYKHSMRYLDIERLTKKLKMGFEPELIKPLAESIPDCDINVATWFMTVFAVYRSGKGLPFYFFQDFEELIEDSFGYNANYYVRMFKESLYLPLNIITGPQWLKEWVKENYGKDAIVYGYGIDHNIFYPRQNVLNNITGLKVMGIFRGYEYKGDKDLINALNRVSKNIPDIYLIAVGNGDDFQEIIKEIPIRFKYTLFERPSDDELAELYTSADLFAFASHIEGYGLPPLKAMACGTPSVITDCLDVRDYVINGENSILVSPKNPSELADAIIKVLCNDNLKEKLNENGLETAQKHAWDKITDKFEKTFIDAMDY